MLTTTIAFPVDVQKEFNRRMLAPPTELEEYSKPLTDIPMARDFFESYNRREVTYSVRDKVIASDNWGCGYHPIGDGSMWVHNKTGKVYGNNQPTVLSREDIDAPVEMLLKGFK